jgi:nitroreductase
MITDTLYNRRSKRRFARKKVEPEKVETLVKSALLAPTSRNLFPWEFILVDDPALLENLSKAKPHGASFLADAPLGIVVAGDTGKSDTWIEDASIASILIQLAAEDLGLGSCWIQIRNRKTESGESSEGYIRKALKLPDNMGVVSVIAVGYPKETKPAYSDSDLHYGQVHSNQYGEKYKRP